MTNKIGIHPSSSSNPRFSPETAKKKLKAMLPIVTLRINLAMGEVLIANMAIKCAQMSACTTINATLTKRTDSKLHLTIYFFRSPPRADNAPWN